jgi:putative tricarboxylic transport membrane protein
MRTVDTTVAGIMMVFSTAVFAFTYTFPERHRSVGVASFPRLLTAIMFGLAIIIIVQARRSRTTREITWDLPTLKKIGVVSLMIAAYIAILQILGFIISTIVFLVTIIRFFGERRVFRLLLAAVGVTVSVYLLFGVLAGVPFPVGLVFR